MAVLILALIEIDTTNSLKILFICKENSCTRSFADLLLWLDPTSGVLGRTGRLVGDQERNKSSYSHTKLDIHPRERRQMLSKCQLVLATGGTVAQDLTMQWSTLGGFMQELSLMVIDEGQQHGTDREIAVISLLRQLIKPPAVVSGASALLAWFPASWASKIAPCFLGEAGGAIQAPLEVSFSCPHRVFEGLQREAADQVLQAIKFTDKKRSRIEPGPG